MRTRTAAAPLVLLVLVRLASAQPLADRVPADAWVYVGWNGAAAMAPGYAGSRLEGVLKATRFPALLADAFASLGRMAAEKDPKADEGFAHVAALASAVWKYPTAAYLAPPPADAGPDAPPRAVVLVRADAEAPALLARLESEVMKEAMQKDQTTVAAADGLVIIASRTAGDPGALAAPRPDPITAHARFRGAAGHFRKDAALVGFMDGAGFTEWVDRNIARGGKPEAIKNWPVLRDALGLTNFKTAVYSAGFDGRDWASETFIEAPAPRQGLAGLFDAPPISEATLKLAPKNAVWLTASRWDLAKLLDDIRAALKRHAPDLALELDKGLAQGAAATGVDLEAQLLRGLGDEWLVYTDPTALGPNGLGFVMVNPLRDAAKVEGALTVLEDLANRRIAAEAGAGGPQFRFTVNEQEGVKIHTLGVPMVAPSWAVHGGRLYVGLFPQAVLTAAHYRKEQPGSILDNEKYAALRSRLGGKPAVAVTFVDLPSTAMQTYQGLVMVTRILPSIVGVRDTNPAGALLPPLAAITPHLAPAGSVAWVDAEGYHRRALSPFPGSGILGPQGSQVSVAQVGLLTGILLPALGAARTTAQQTSAMSDARQLLVAMMAYANDHDDQLPPELTTLLEGGYVDNADLLVVDSAPVAPPPDLSEWDAAKSSAWLEENGSFVFLQPGSKLRDLKAQTTILIYQKPAHTRGEKLLLGFADGHVENKPIQEALTQIREQHPGHVVPGVDPPAAKPLDLGNPK